MPSTAPVSKRDVPLAIKSKEHLEGLPEVTPVETEGGKSVQELRQLYEAKVKALSACPSKVGVPEYTAPCTCSRPTSAGTEGRQDACSMETPHPEGKYLGMEEPNACKPTLSWYLANTTVENIPNGLQLTLILKNDYLR
ncbi:AGAP003747-PA-like protein [Anopheles sinensis]|uniref:AGAP003747-PA-like protein n=1 Tax=Anopheles sinensis TaxID=74873 RepID=A0A084VR99_ANOSI|nr:AGAP003747-PA-like protein [Anopheles sinensis]